jgi:hypothetical protein
MLRLGRIKMRVIRFSSIGWLIGYFVVLAPLNYIIKGELIWGLIHACIGLIGAIIIEVMSR